MFVYEEKQPKFGENLRNLKKHVFYKEKTANLKKNIFHIQNGKTKNAVIDKHEVIQNMSLNFSLVRK